MGFRNGDFCLIDRLFDEDSTGQCTKGVIKANLEEESSDVWSDNFGISRQIISNQNKEEMKDGERE